MGDGRGRGYWPVEWGLGGVRGVGVGGEVCRGSSIDNICWSSSDNQTFLIKCSSDFGWAAMAVLESHKSVITSSIRFSPGANFLFTFPSLEPIQ